MEGFLILLVIGVGIYIAIRVVNANAAKEALRLKRVAADAFLNNLTETKTLPEISVSIVLKKGETGVLQEQSNLFETRAQRLYGGGGTRIGKIYVGGGASESVQRLRRIDSGTLVLTNQRLVFDGGSQNRATNLADVLSASTWQDAIEISSSRRQKSQVYSVSNPTIWASMIQNLANGNISVRQQIKAS
jgi:hypothetical protein